MAKQSPSIKQEPKPEKVECRNCHFGGTVENCLLSCSNKECNPHNYKVVDWPRYCSYYKQKQ